MPALSTHGRQFALWMLQDSEWGLASHVRPEWQAPVADAIAVISSGAAASAGLVAVLERADTAYDICGSESLALALADAGSAVAKYCIAGDLDAAARAHLWGWSLNGRTKPDIEAAQAAARGG